MKALTIRQPWASLIVEGVKTVETRSWNTKHRGSLAIHAGLYKPPTWWANWRDDEFRSRSGAPWFEELENYCEWGESSDGDWHFYAWCGVRGAIVATCDLVDVLPITADWCEDGGSQIPYGDFTLGRFAWILENVQRCDPIPAKGKQGLWDWSGQAKGEEA